MVPSSLPSVSTQPFCAFNNYSARTSSSSLTWTTSLSSALSRSPPSSSRRSPIPSGPCTASLWFSPNAFSIAPLGAHDRLASTRRSSGPPQASSWWERRSETTPSATNTSWKTPRDPLNEYRPLSLCSRTSNHFRRASSSYAAPRLFGSDTSYGLPLPPNPSRQPLVSTTSSPPRLPNSSISAPPNSPSHGTPTTVDLLPETNSPSPSTFRATAYAISGTWLPSPTLAPSPSRSSPSVTTFLLWPPHSPCLRRTRWTRLPSHLPSRQLSLPLLDSESAVCPSPSTQTLPSLGTPSYSAPGPAFSAASAEPSNASDTPDYSPPRPCPFGTRTASVAAGALEPPASSLPFRLDRPSPSPMTPSASSPAGASVYPFPPAS